MNYLIFFNSKVEIQVILNNKYNKISILRGSDPMPLKKWLLDRNLIKQGLFKGFLMILRENRVGSYPFGNLQNLTVPILRVKQAF